MKPNSNHLSVEQTYDAPIGVVWKAITDPDQMRRWFFEPIMEFKAEPGFETKFNVTCEGRDFLHVWKVTDVEQFKRLAYGWRYDGYAGDSTVIWELSETPNGTKLTLKQEIHEPFQLNDPMFTPEAAQAAWDYFVQESLPAFLAGTPLPRKQGDS